MLLLVIGFVVIVALLVTVVANASTAFLVRRSLSAWADGAATAAAQSVDEGAVYGGRVGHALPLSAARAREAVAGYAVRNGLPGRFELLSVRADDQSTASPEPTPAASMGDRLVLGLARRAPGLLRGAARRGR